jgi:hypothetical protein
VEDRRRAGWADTFDAEYVALTAPGDALITFDSELAETVSGLVETARSTRSPDEAAGYRPRIEQ